MTQKKKVKLEKPLTEVELELMNVIWDLGTCTVKEVQKALEATRDLAYTSVATIMKILEQKGALTSRKDDRVHIYQPLLLRQDYEAVSLKHLTDNVFKGDPSSMVMRLISENKLSNEEIQNIRKLLDQRIGK